MNGYWLTSASGLKGMTCAKPRGGGDSARKTRSHTTAAVAVTAALALAASHLGPLPLHPLGALSLQNARLSFASWTLSTTRCSMDTRTDTISVDPTANHRWALHCPGTAGQNERNSGTSAAAIVWCDYCCHKRGVGVLRSRALR